MQKFDAAKRAKQNQIYSSKPSQLNESDTFFKGIPDVVASKTDAQLSLIDPAQARVVTNYLTGCADLNSYRGGLADSQHKGEGVRLERHLGARACAGYAPPPAPEAVPGSQGTSSSSYTLGEQHEAMVELCCGEHSLISSKAQAAGMETLRITKKSHNLMSSAGLEAAREDVRRLAGGYKTHLWASLPCRPWSQWNELNCRKLGKKFRVYVDELRIEAMHFISAFIEIAEIVIANGGSVSFEWPAYCAGWGVESLAAFFEQQGFNHQRKLV